VNSDDDFERTIGALAKDIGADFIALRRNMRERLPPVMARSPERDALAPTVVARLLDVDTAFASAALTLPVEGCPCCTDPAFCARLERIPAMSLSEDDLAEVVSSLTLTFGSTEDVPYFVPRLCADGLQSPLYDITLAFARIASSGYTEWPAARREAVRRFLAAQLRFVLSGEPVRSSSETLNDIASLYQCLGYLGYEEEFFRVWERPLPDAADEHLPRLLLDIEVDEGGTLTMPRAWRALDLDRLAAWLTSPPMLDHLERGIATHPAQEKVQASLLAFKHRCSNK
jgi:hypothetical protein